MTSGLRPRLRRYLITDARADSVERMIEISRAALAGGMTTVQLRAKGWSDRDLYRAAVGLRGLCHEAGALFVVNDRVDLALASNADGVHLGVDDLPVQEARRLLGPDAVIGYSPETDADRRAAEQAGVDYLGIGPVYGTGTKPDAGIAIGIDGLRRVIDATPLPVVGIGGVSVERAPDIVRAGAVGVAVVGAVFLADDPREAARSLTQAAP